MKCWRHDRRRRSVADRPKRPALHLTHSAEGRASDSLLWLVLEQVARHAPEGGGSRFRLPDGTADRESYPRSAAAEVCSGCRTEQQTGTIPSPNGSEAGGEDCGQAPSPRCSRTWAMLIKRVYEVDPLACPKCGGQMKVVAFIEPPQGAVIEKILRHCGLWRPSRAPPRSGGRRPPPVDFPSPESETGAGRDDWSDADWFYDLTEDFAQVGPDDSAYVDIDPFEAVF